MTHIEPRLRVRRVVTGHDLGGRSVFASDTQVEPKVLRSLPGWEFVELWGADKTPTYPDNGREPPWETYFPPLEGIRFSFSTIPPEGLEPPDDLDPETAAAETESALPGMLAHMEPEHPGMHTTDTLDLEIVLRGELILELDDGAEKHLSAGDTVVQNGTRHRWRNPGSEPALLAVCMVGARRARP